MLMASSASMIPIVIAYQLIYSITSCYVADCGDVNIPNGNAVAAGGTKFGQNATVSCNTGYDLQGSSVVLCVANGTWDSFPACKVQG